MNTQTDKMCYNYIYQDVFQYKKRRNGYGQG